MNHKRSRDHKFSQNLSNVKILHKENTWNSGLSFGKQNFSIDSEMKRFDHLTMRASSSKSQKKLSEKEMDALFFLVEEYTRAYKIDPNVKSMTLVEFWKHEYSQQALIHKARKGELNPAFVEDILSPYQPKCKKLLENHHDILMLKTLAKMDEENIRSEI
jgi:hypothetical protein